VTVPNIPKIIHFTWMSDDEHATLINRPALINRCLRSWRKYCPDYQIIHWDRNRFDINSLLFTQQAFERRQWAFIADVHRLYALYHYGGIYLDSDVELLKTLDPLLDNKVFMGFEDDHLLSSGVLGSERGHPWIKLLLDHYTQMPFVNPDGSLNNTPNTFIVTRLAHEYLNLQAGGAHQVLRQGVRVYPREWFSPKEVHTGEIHASGDTYAIHHFTGSWLPRSVRLSRGYRRLTYQVKTGMRFIIGEKMMGLCLDCKRSLFSK